jgi:hypothetical protein
MEKTKQIQIIEMLRNIYELNNDESLKIYNKIVLDKSKEEVDIIFNDLVKIIKNKNDILKKLSIDLNKVHNKYEEKRERENDEEINFNI